jgi:hypothetical protein
MRTALVILTLVAAVVLAGCQTSKNTDKAQPADSVKPAAKTPAPQAAKGEIAVEAEKFATVKNATVKDDAKASGGKAVLFDQDSSMIETTVDLPAGKFQVVVMGSSISDKDDAVNLTVAPVDPKSVLRRAQNRVIFDAEANGYIAGTSHDEAIVLNVPAATQVKVTIETTEEKNMRIDRLTFQPAK